MEDPVDLLTIFVSEEKHNIWADSTFLQNSNRLGIAFCGISMLITVHNDPLRTITPINFFTITIFYDLGVTMVGMVGTVGMVGPITIRHGWPAWPYDRGHGSGGHSTMRTRVVYHKASWGWGHMGFMAVSVWAAANPSQFSAASFIATKNTCW